MRNNVESVIETLTWIRKLIDDNLTTKQLRRKVEKAIRDMEFLQQKQKRV